MEISIVMPYDEAISEALHELNDLAAGLWELTDRHYVVSWELWEDSFVLMEPDDYEGWPVRRYNTAEECRADIQALLQDPSPLEKCRNPSVVEMERIMDEQGYW